MVNTNSVDIEKIIRLTRQYLTVQNVTIALTVLLVLIAFSQTRDLYKAWRVSDVFNNTENINLNLPVVNNYVDDDALDLFGYYKPQADSITQETTLPLVLRGIYYTENSTSSTAFISYSNQPEQAYAQGAQLPGNVELYTIERDHVILYHQNRFERLGFPDDEILKQYISEPQSGELNSAEPAYSRIISEELAQYLGLDDESFDEDYWYDKD